MALVNFTNLDFDQIKTSIRDYLRANSNFTDYDFEGSNLSTILDILAYNTYISSYNANMMSNEVFIDSATLRENVASLARNIGYVPRSRTAAKAVISFFVDVTGSSTNPITLTLKRGTVCASSSFGAESYIFSISSDITVPIVNGIAFFENIEVYEGSFLTANFTVEAENPSPPQRYILTNENIDTSTISVLVRNTQSSTFSRKFNLSNSLFEISSNSRVFFIQEIEDQRYELIFGDGVFGEKLQAQNYIDVSYIVTNGENGNGVSSFTFNGRIVDNNNNLITSGISLITTINSSQGGKEIESVQSIKNYAPRIYASQNRAVTAADYEAIIPKIYPETQSVSVFGGEDLNPPQYGKVFIAIKPFYGPYLPNSIKDNLKNQLRKYNVAGIIPEFLDLKYLYIETDTVAYYNSNLVSNSESIKTTIFENIKSYANSIELNQYGARFKYSKFQSIIDNSHESITSNITKIKIRRDLKASLNQIADYEICFGNEFHIQNVNGYNIKSSGFKISGVSDVLYLSDIPDSNQVTGTIFFFKLLSDTQPLIVRQSAGTINYKKGEIILNPVNIISTSKTVQEQPIIEISAISKSNDIIGLQDLYLQLDINKSVVNMLSDEISSGSDPSGTLYVTTSSYNNGNLVRV
ncbi:MAG: Synechococcus phage [Bacteroidota bacterium]